MVSQCLQYTFTTPTVASESAEMHHLSHRFYVTNILHIIFLSQSIQRNKVVWCQLKEKTVPDCLQRWRHAWTSCSGSVFSGGEIEDFNKAYYNGQYLQNINNEDMFEYI